MNDKKLLRTLLALSVMSLSACATIIKGSSESITVNSMEKGTTLYIDGAARGVDSAYVQVKKGRPHMIRAVKDGCQDGSGETSDSFDATSLLGILIDFGIISIPIDLISGSAWKIEPLTYTVNPICKK